MDHWQILSQQRHALDRGNLRIKPSRQIVTGSLKLCWAHITGRCVNQIADQGLSGSNRRMMGINTASASPYLGVGMYRIRATPRLDESTLEEFGIGEVSGFSSSDAFTEGYAPIAFHLGTRFLSGDFQFLLGSTISPSAGISLSAGLGYAY